MQDAFQQSAKEAAHNKQALAVTMKKEENMNAMIVELTAVSWFTMELIGWLINWLIDWLIGFNIVFNTEEPYRKLSTRLQ